MLEEGRSWGWRAAGRWAQGIKETFLFTFLRLSVLHGRQ